jgi:hypothetical protein
VGFFRNRHHRATYVPPEPEEPVSESTVEEAREQLYAISERDSEIDGERAKLLKIQRENALGPRFWAAVGERRA